MCISVYPPFGVPVFVPVENEGPAHLGGPMRTRLAEGHDTPGRTSLATYRMRT